MIHAYIVTVTQHNQSYYQLFLVMCLSVTKCILAKLTGCAIKK